jgi:tetratricopeptide (TPR) repeat protein
METKEEPGVLRLVVVFLRFYCDMTQVEFGRAAGVNQGYVSLCESGKKVPTEEALRRMAVAAVLPWPLVVHLRRFYSAILTAAARRSAMDRGAELPERALLEPALLAVSSYLIEDSATKPSRQTPEEARREAEEVWTALERLPTHRRRWVLELSLPAFRSLALVVRVCEASVRAAADKPGEALELADLAFAIAGQVEGTEAWRSRVKGFALAHIANARRVANDFAGADEAFAQAWRLWRAGATGEADLLPEWRLLDLEASLRREQQRFAEAMTLLDRALAAGPGNRATAGRILLKQELVLEEMGDIEGALVVLAQAAPFVKAAGDSRLLSVLYFNTVKNLCYLERFAEAANLLPEIQDLAGQLGNELDLIRVVWLSARVAAGQGRRAEAMAGLEQVRHEFTALRLPYDAAQACLELAVLYLEEGRTGEVKGLAIAMGWIFTAQGIRRETLAALKLFVDAAQEEVATVKLIRRILDDIERVRRAAPKPASGQRGRG